MPKIERKWKSFDDWNDISNEESRFYIFPFVGPDDKVRLAKIVIEEPRLLWVSGRTPRVGGHSHRIITKNGDSRYIPAGWIDLGWPKKKGCKDQYEF